MKPTTAFKDKTLMITGGTGSFGSTVLKHFMGTEIGEIRIFSRDEKKQDDMRHRLQEKSPELAGKVRFFIGDVRDLQSVRDAMHGVDYIFHAAALKQVPSCEFFPMEAVRTNVLGTDNVLHAAIAEGVERVVCLSTDKAAYPINAMGKSKAMMESIIYANARNGAGRTTICCTRYGNVMCSRGSVIPLFIDRIPLCILKMRQVFSVKMLDAFALPANEVRTISTVLSQVSSYVFVVLRTLNESFNNFSAVRDDCRLFFAKADCRAVA